MIWVDISPKKILLMTSKHMTRWLTSLVFREMQIKSTMRYHFTPWRRIIIKNADNKCEWECGEIWVLIHGGWECKMVQPFWKMYFENTLKNVNIELPYDQANSTPRYITKKTESICSIKNMYECSQQHYSQQPKSRNNPNECQLVNV